MVLLILKDKFNSYSFSNVLFILCKPNIQVLTFLHMYNILEKYIIFSLKYWVMTPKAETLIHTYIYVSFYFFQNNKKQQISKYSLLKIIINHKNSAINYKLKNRVDLGNIIKIQLIGSIQCKTHQITFQIKVKNYNLISRYLQKGIMKFLITVKQQSQAINGKAKYPLYKPANDKTYDQDKGLQSLNQLMQNSSVKLFCCQCEKEITIEVIIIAHGGFKEVPKVQEKKNDDTKQKKDTTKNSAPEKAKRGRGRRKRSKIQVQDEKLFQQEQDEEQHHYLQKQINSESQYQQYEQKEVPIPTQVHKLEIGQKNDDKIDDIQTTQITHLYCVGCFASLQEFTQCYSIRKSLKFSPLNSQWRVYDEICLLNGLKFWGFGNWSQIKQFMDYNSSLFDLYQIQQHYEELYIKGDGPLFPQLQQFHIQRMNKPEKKSFQQILHDYYYPQESEQEISQIKNKNDAENSNLKRQRSIAQDQLRQQQIIQLNKKSRLSCGKAYKYQIDQKGFLKDSDLNSNASLINQNNGRQIENRNIRKQRKSQIESQQPQSEDSYQLQNDRGHNSAYGYDETHLKPRSSNKMPQKKPMLQKHHSGKCIQQPFGSKIPSSQSVQILPSHNTNQKIQLATSSSYSNPLLKGHNVYSYNPKRKQFQIIEYDYYAETMLAQLQFTENDCQQEIQLKIKIIQEYNKRLDERVKRREFVIQHRLLDTQFMIKAIRKYNKVSVKRFQPFRRLIQRNQDYYQLIDYYNKISKVKSLTQGILKIKRKISATKKNANFKDILEYINKKKQKKQLLGHRLKSQNQAQRKVFYREVTKPNKKLILTMSENSSAYVVNAQNTQAMRTMTSRSQQRQRLKSTQHTQNSQNRSSLANQQSNGQTLANQHSQNQQHQSFPQNNGLFIPSPTSLQSLLPQQEISLLQKVAKRIDPLTEQNEPSCIMSIQKFKPLILKNFTIKSLAAFISPNKIQKIIELN